MGYRDDDKLTTEQSDQNDQALRILLTGQLQHYSAPPNLTSKVLARLPPLTPARAWAAELNRRRWRVAVALAGASLLVLLLSLGLWGVAIDSDDLALLLGGTHTGPGRIALVLTLAAKPLTGLFAMLGTPLLLTAMMFFSATSWGWWLLVRTAPDLVFVETIQ